MGILRMAGVVQEGDGLTTELKVALSGKTIVDLTWSK
jgi:hypothetical protein